MRAECPTCYGNDADLLRGNDYMSDWMNDEWQDFVDVQRIDTDAMPPEALKLLKEAWLHGARAAIAIAKDMVDEFAAKPI